MGIRRGQVEVWHGLYIISSYKTATLYAAKAAKANGNDSCHIYTVEVPLLAEDNHIFSCKPVNTNVVQRTKDAIGEVIPNIVSGIADGADTLAIRYADEYQLTKILFPANWKSYKRIAGFLRNEDMLSIAIHLEVFWDGKSSGTRHMIEIAKAKGIPVWGLKHPCASCFGDFQLERWS